MTQKLFHRFSLVSLLLPPSCPLCKPSLSLSKTTFSLSYLNWTPRFFSSLLYGIIQTVFYFFFQLIPFRSITCTISKILVQISEHSRRVLLFASLHITVLLQPVQIQAWFQTVLFSHVRNVSYYGKAKQLIDDY